MKLETIKINLTKISLPPHLLRSAGATLSGAARMLVILQANGVQVGTADMSGPLASLLSILWIKINTTLKLKRMGTERAVYEVKMEGANVFMYVTSSVNKPATTDTNRGIEFAKKVLETKEDSDAVVAEYGRAILNEEYILLNYNLGIIEGKRTVRFQRARYINHHTHVILASSDVVKFIVDQKWMNFPDDYNLRDVVSDLLGEEIHLSPWSSIYSNYKSAIKFTHGDGFVNENAAGLSVLHRSISLKRLVIDRNCLSELLNNKGSATAC